MIHEIFDPAPPVVRWKSNKLDDVIDATNGTGFGLTLGAHNRIDETIEHIANRAKIGNTQFNRNQIGAVGEQVLEARTLALVPKAMSGI